MDLYESLMEIVITEDTTEEYIERRLLEGVLSKAGLNKEDLQNPDKVRAAIKNLNGITSEFEKRNTAISILTALLQAINSLIAIFGKTDTKAKVINVLVGLLIQVVSEGAKYHFGVSDYRKLLAKIDTQIKHVTDKIAKENKSNNPDKQKIRDLEEIRENLRKSKDEVLKRMKAENKIEGNGDEKINPEPQNPIAAFTGLI